ncbi:MAG: hypothetical protein JWN37_421 [Candidatus Nomurabacteria bacterium]|nr:hypothetical protein [Candidatus Nomurabacteria bacterium]
MSINLKSKLTSLYPNADIEAFKDVPNAFYYKPSSKLFKADALSKGGFVFQISARDFFDENLVRDCLLFALNHEEEIASLKDYVVISGFKSKGYAFDTLVAVSSDISQTYKVEDPELSLITRKIFPAYKCEFSGKETAKEMMYLYTKALHPSDLKREPNPLIRISYTNIKTQGFTFKPFEKKPRGPLTDEIIKEKKKDRGISSVPSLMHAIETLNGVEGESYVDIENYKGELANIKWDKTYIVKTNDREKKFTVEEIKEWIKDFIY